MPTRRKTARAKSSESDSKQSIAHRVDDAVAALKRLGNKRARDELGPRYGIHVKNAFGVGVGQIQKLAKEIGLDHDLALALWDADGAWHEVRMLAAFVDEPQRVTSAQMDRWCRDFDNWGIVDTVCFKLFDQVPLAFDKAHQWSKSPREFIKRAGYVLMACLAAHDKSASDAKFLACLPLIEQGALDERNFVKKGVSWGLRMIGHRNLALHKAALAVAKRLSESGEAPRRWVGKDAVRDLSNPKVRARLARKGK